MSHSWLFVVLLYNLVSGDYLSSSRFIQQLHKIRWCRWLNSHVISADGILHCLTRNNPVETIRNKSTCIVLINYIYYHMINKILNIIIKLYWYNNYYYKLRISWIADDIMGALLKTVPTKVYEPHRGCVIHLQQPKSNISNPKYRNLSSVSNSVLCE